MQTIILPEGTVKTYMNAVKFESNNRWWARDAIKEIERLNEKFFRACRERINRKMRRARVSCSLHVRLAHTDDNIYAMADLQVYLGSNQVTNLSCNLTKTNDSDAMCELAIKIHELRTD